MNLTIFLKNLREYEPFLYKKVFDYVFIPCYEDKEKRTKPVVMIEAHSDEVGFMVQSIEANGLLKFITVGGWSNEQVQAHRVKVLNNEGQYIEGIISSIPP